MHTQPVNQKSIPCFIYSLIIMVIKSFLSLLLVIWIGIVFTNAQDRSESQILEFANRHFSGSRRINTRSVGTLLIPATRVLPSTTRSSSGEPFYIATSAQGTVIISGDERMKPILGYSDKGNITDREIPENMQALFSIYAMEYAYLKENPTMQVPASTKATSGFPAKVEPLLDFAWGQTNPFNNLCPIRNDQRMVTGCVATAMAQIIRYHKYPERAKGSVSYSYDDLSELGVPYDLSVTLNLEQEPLRYDLMSSSTSEQEKNHAIAWLMACCGASVKTKYGLLSSSASDRIVPTALVNNFGYQDNIQYYMYSHYTNAEWLAIIKKEVYNRRPVFCTGLSAIGLGHSFVLDGYNEDDLIHVNWGYAGEFNGYYEMSSLNPGFSGPGSSIGGYNVGVRILTGIQPPTTTNTYVSNIFSADGEITINPPSSISRSGSFSINGASCSNNGSTFSGKLQAALFKDGKVAALLEPPIIKNNLQYSEMVDIRFSNLTIPSSVPVGSYQLYIVSKDNRETNWQIVGYPQTKIHYYDVKITTTEVIFSNPIKLDGLKMVSFEQVNKLYYNRGGKFNITLQNIGTEWLGRAGIILKPIPPNTGRDIVLAEDRKVFVAGESRFELYTEAVRANPGEYILEPSYSYNGTSWIPFDASEEKRVIIYPEPQAGSYTFSDISVKLNKTITDKDTLQVTFSFKNTGHGPFDDKITIVVYTNSGYEKMLENKIFVDSNEKFSKKYSVPNIPDGDYFLRIFRTDYQVGVRDITDNHEFSVRSLFNKNNP